MEWLATVNANNKTDKISRFPLQQRVYRGRIHDVEQLLKSRLIEQWKLFNQTIIDEAVKAVTFTLTLHASTLQTF